MFSVLRGKNSWRIGGELLGEDGTVIISKPSGKNGCRSLLNQGLIILGAGLGLEDGFVGLSFVGALARNGCGLLLDKGIVLLAFGEESRGGWSIKGSSILIGARGINNGGWSLEEGSMLPRARLRIGGNCSNKEVFMLLGVRDNVGGLSSCEDGFMVSKLKTKNYEELVISNQDHVTRILSLISLEFDFMLSIFQSRSRSHT
jgi:F0F1-type ATP synthase membrane subunit c/vacuolar-type H+-ATPase subunit K